MSLQQEREWYRHDQYITCQVKDQVGDEMMQGRGTLHIIRRRLPVVVKWSAPDSEVEDLHHDIGGDHVGCRTLDDEILLQVLSQAPVEE